MVDAPEKIWVHPKEQTHWTTLPPETNTLVQFVRSDIAERQIAELRAAIAGKPMDPSVTHGQFVEMAQTLHAACDGGRSRAEAAEADNARLREALRAVRQHFNVELTDDGRIAGIGHDSEALPKVIAILDAVLSGSGAGGWRVPDGWRLVPAEPTLGQQNAGWREVDKQGFATEDTEVAPIYRAMIAAAPTATGGR